MREAQDSCEYLSTRHRVVPGIRASFRAPCIGAAGQGDGELINQDRGGIAWLAAAGGTSLLDARKARPETPTRRGAPPARVGFDQVTGGRTNLCPGPATRAQIGDAQQVLKRDECGRLVHGSWVQPA